MKKASSKEGVGQLFFIVGGDEDQGPNGGFDQFFGLVAVKLHAIELSEQIVGKLNVCFVNFIDEQGDGLLCGESPPKNALNNVILDVLDPRVAELRVSKAAHGVVFIEALLCLGGGFDVPL